MGDSQDVTKKKISAFDVRDLVCPICGRNNQIRSVKTRLYIKKDLDPDSRPARYSWTDKGFEHLNPRQYQAGGCSQCSWASDIRFYEDPGKGSSIPTKSLVSEIKKRREEPAHAAALEILCHGISHDNNKEMDYLQAIQLHLLALYNQLMLKGVINREPFHVGRFALRSAWLFRDVFTNPTEKKKWAAPIRDLLKKLKPHWKNCPQREEDLLEIAAEYYQASLTRSRMIETARDETEFMLLVARIMMKLGRVPEAREFLALGKSKVNSFKTETKESERKVGRQGEKVTQDDVNKAKADVRRMERSFDNVQNIYEDIQQAWEDQQIENAQKIIEKNTGMAREELRKLLEKNDIDPKIARKLTPEPKKKGILSSLFG